MADRSPDASIVMTAYNAASTVAASIASILDQTHSSFELVFVDDGSTDDTLRIVSEIEDPRIVLISPGRLGRSGAFNKAVETARGPIIVVNDADDESLPTRIETQLDCFASHPDVDVIGGQMIAHYGAKEWLLRFPTTHDAIFRELDEGRMPIAHAASAFRRDWFLAQGGMNVAYTRVEDFELYYRSRRVTRFAAVPTAVLRYHFRTLGFSQWASDESLHAKVVHGGAPKAPPRWSYLRYRAAVWAQQRQLGLGRRG
jgi:glycosyltransferase involved in cell wall biosynthesis